MKRFVAANRFMAATACAGRLVSREGPGATYRQNTSAKWRFLNWCQATCQETVAATIPNQGILIDTLALQEAKASSEIENIVTTQDELFQLGLFPDGLESAAAKEVARYRDALKLGLTQLLDTGGLIRNATLIQMYQFLKARSDGFRSTPGTALMNDRTGEVIYVPPQDRNEIITAMS